MGSYAETAAVPAHRLVSIPPGVTQQQGPQLAHPARNDRDDPVYGVLPVKKGDTALLHAAVGGVTLILTQMAQNIGARLIGTVLTQAEAEAGSPRGGADEIILYSQVDFETETKKSQADKEWTSSTILLGR